MTPDAALRIMRKKLALPEWHPNPDGACKCPQCAHYHALLTAAPRDLCPACGADENETHAPECWIKNSPKTDTYPRTPCCAWCLGQNGDHTPACPYAPGNMWSPKERLIVRTDKGTLEVNTTTGDIRRLEGAAGTKPALRAYTSAERKQMPVHSILSAYFPDAIAAVARHAKKANDKHNPGEPLHWAREKSTDHLECAARHLMTPDEIDADTGEIELVGSAWRTLAAIQLREEKRLVAAGIKPLSGVIPAKEKK